MLKGLCYRANTESLLGSWSRRAGKDSSGILDVSDASSEGTSKAQNSAEEPKQRKRSSSSSAFSGRVASRPLFARYMQCFLQRIKKIRCMSDP